MLQFGSKHVCFEAVHIFKHCHEMTHFLLWTGTYCISRVVQQTSGVKDLSSLVRYDDSCLAALRHVQSIVPVVRPRPNIRSHSILFSFNIDSKGKSYFRLSKLILYWTVFQNYRTMAKQLTISDQLSAICINNALNRSVSTNQTIQQILQAVEMMPDTHKLNFCT